jgi:anti-sigma factor RsiW
LSGRIDLSHPEFASIVQHVEGGGDPAVRRALERHLSECEDCRREAARLKAAETGGEADPALLEVMLAAAAEWDRTHDQAAVRRAVADGVRPYVGDRAADRLTQGSEGDAAKLLTELEPVLGLFLGRQAAARLVSHILDRALVRR